MTRTLSLLFWAFLLVFFSVPSVFKGLQFALLRQGFSWLMSCWLPYALVLIAAMGVCFAVLTLLPSRSRITRLSIASLILLIPIATCCIQHPIYEDMILDLSDSISGIEAIDYEDADLVVLALADCAFCEAAISELKVLHDRNPLLRIRMVLCTADSAVLASYAEQAGVSFEVAMASNLQLLSSHAEGHFPSYVMVEQNRPTRRWTPNVWGPVARDIVESSIGN
jgi:hypothetical protein